MRTPFSTTLRRVLLGTAGAAVAACVVSTQALAQQKNDPYHQAPKDTVSPAVYDGWKQFQLNCARCHGETGDGTSFAPSLTESLKSKRINKQGFMQTVCAGRPDRGMPAWCKLGMEMKTIDNIHAWVQERADGKVGPERPAVREEEQAKKG